MKINTSNEIYTKLYDSIYKTMSGLNSPNLRKDLVARNYQSFLKEGMQHITLAEIAKSKAKREYKVFNPMLFNTNLVALENYAPVKVLLEQYSSKFDTLYPKTRGLRKTLIEMESVEFGKVNPALDNANKTLAKIKAFFSF